MWICTTTLFKVLYLIWHQNTGVIQHHVRSMRHFPWNHRYINWFSGEYSSRLMLFFASSSVWNRVTHGCYTANFNMKIIINKYTGYIHQPFNHKYYVVVTWVFQFPRNTTNVTIKLHEFHANTNVSNRSSYT